MPIRSSNFKSLFLLRKEIPKKSKLILGLLSFVFFIGFWAFLTYLNLVKPLLLPPPHEVLKSSIELFSKYNFLKDILASTYRIVFGFLVSAIFALPLGIIMGSYKAVDAFLAPITAFIRYMPVTAFIPLLILWFGIGHIQKISLLFIGVFFYLLSLIVNIVGEIKEEIIETAYTLGANNKQIIRKVVFPAAMPEIYDSLRTMMGGGWTLIVAAELVASESGIGKMIIDSQRFLKTPRVITGILIIGIIGVISDQAFRIFKPILFPWKKISNN